MGACGWAQVEDQLDRQRWEQMQAATSLPFVSPFNWHFGWAPFHTTVFENNGYSQVFDKTRVIWGPRIWSCGCFCQGHAAGVNDFCHFTELTLLSVATPKPENPKMAFFSGICGSFADFCVCFCPKFPAFWSVFCLRISTLRHWNWPPEQKRVPELRGNIRFEVSMLSFSGGGTLGDRSDSITHREQLNPQKTIQGPDRQLRARGGKMPRRNSASTQRWNGWLTAFMGRIFLVCFAFQTFTPITNMCLWSNEVPGQYLDSTWTVPGQYLDSTVWIFCGGITYDIVMGDRRSQAPPEAWPNFWQCTSGTRYKKKMKETKYWSLGFNHRMWALDVWGVRSSEPFFRRRLRGRRQCQGNVLDMWRTHGEQRTPQHTRTFWANTHESTFSWNGQVEANDPVHVTGHVIVRKWSTNESLRTDWKEPVTK